MTNAFVQSMARNFEDALRLMEVALSDRPRGLWGTDLWPDVATTGPGQHGGLHGSSPWFLGYHGTLFGVLVGSIPLHVVEHASQIRQFITAAGVKPQPTDGR